MKPTFVSMLLACVIFSCNPLKKVPSAESQLPSIAAIGKKSNTLLHTNFKQVGEPHLSKKIAARLTIKIKWGRKNVAKK